VAPIDIRKFPRSQDLVEVARLSKHPEENLMESEVHSKCLVEGPYSTRRNCKGLEHLESISAKEKNCSTTLLL